MKVNNLHTYPSAEYQYSQPQEVESIAGYDSSHNTLRCLNGCSCRCHNSSVMTLIPPILTPYLGYILLPKRLSRLFSSYCDVQTCRGDLQQVLRIIWVLPQGSIRWYMSLQLTLWERFPISLSIIGTRRAIPWSAAIWSGIARADLDAVRMLLSTGKASVWDADSEGWPIFAVSHFSLSVHPTRRRYSAIHPLI